MPIKRYLGISLLLCSGLLIGLFTAEGLSRIFLPVFPGSQILSLEGEELNKWPCFGCRGDQSPRVYRMYSEEYDALTTFTEKGYRVPESVGDPEIVFIGDSFTFGQGLSDKETFVYIFCTTLQVSCVNLAFPGASTISELNRLEKVLTAEGWRPKHVVLFILAMTQFMGEGNDLSDNLRDYKESNRSTLPNNSKPLNSSVIDNFLFLLLTYRRPILEHSNLARIVKFHFGPQIKRYLAPSPTEDLLNKSLSITKEQLNRLERLGREHNFEYHIFLIHPVQDISRGSHQDTLAKLQSISPNTIIPTAHLFQPDPDQYYFPLDGHFNAAGSQKIANYLLSEWDDGAFILEKR